MNETEGVCLSVCVYVCMGEVVKKNERLKDAEMKGSEGKRPTPSAQPSQHVPITAALKQRPARHCFWLILRAVDERKEV